jgi:hypothetical protein
MSASRSSPATGDQDLERPGGLGLRQLIDQLAQLFLGGSSQQER